MLTLIFLLKIFTIVLLSWVIGPVNTSIFHIIGKYNIWEWYDIYKKKWMPKRCEFCVAFWLGVIEVSAVQFIAFDPWLFVASFAGASITLHLYKA